MPFHVRAMSANRPGVAPRVSVPGWPLAAGVSPFEQQEMNQVYYDEREPVILTVLIEIELISDLDQSY